MKKTGELLKSKRESANLSLSEVALATKINPKVLTAIESGDEGSLPAKTFLKGFIRSYALYLKMDVEDVMRSFIEETGGPAPVPAHEAYQKQDASGSSGRRAVGEESSSGLRTMAVVVITVLIGLIIGVRELVDKYQREKVAAAVPSDVKVSPLGEEKPAQAAADAPTKTEDKPVAPEKPVAATPKAKPEAVASLAGIPKALELPLEPKHQPASTNEAKPVEVAEAPKPVEPEAKPVEAKSAEGKPADPVAAENAKPADTSLKNEVIIEALDKVEVKMEIAGELKTVALAPNEVHVVRTAGGLTMNFSDGGAVSLVHNGRVRGTPGKLGEPKQVKFQ